ncbi:MAG: zinc dependent phospholipase C family protein [Clostridia bacterium]|nr:zinc dependent phospholipase C family protein [Clostridia bacterium]
MPASYVHQCIAKDTCDSLHLFEDDQLCAALLAGSEGPDPFFFSVIPLPGALSVPKLGSLMHTKKTGDFLIALAKACSASEITRAYCCGFFSHYAADTTCHPFVYAHSLQADGQYSGVIHCTLEHGLETLFYRRRGNDIDLPTQMAGFLLLSNENKDKIARALSAALNEVFPEHRIALWRVRRSFEDAAFLCTLLRSPGGRRYSALGAIASLIGMKDALHAHMMPKEPPAQDIANDAHAVWFSPWAPETPRTDSFSDLYDAAKSRAGVLIVAAIAFMRDEMNEAALRFIAGDNSFDSGISWKETLPAGEVFAMRRDGEANSR